ncbi:MAG: hypothetical protein J6X60_09125, partial [Ruminiclostridium sp.]|nr:hypothetical protein [Ruminiclostridium sp.]
RSCDNIIGFFNSGEYKKYNAATYISRNLYKTDSGDSFGDILAPRMVKLYPETRYENPVHESLNTFRPPYKNLRDIADHYGYYYENEEDKYRKFKRNSELLLKRLDTEKDTSPMLYVQLYEAFMGVKEYDKALFYLECGIDLAKKMNSIVLAALYFNKASYYQTGKEFEKAISVCDEYFGMSGSIRPHPLSTDGEMHALKAMCLYELGRYSEAVGAFGRFFDVYRDIESGKIATYDAYLFTAYMCSEINILPLFGCFLDSCIKADKYNTADSRLRTFPVRRYSFEPDKIRGLVRNEIITAAHFSYRNVWDYYRKLDEYGRNVFRTALLKELLTSRDSSGIVNALSDIAGREKSDESTAAVHAAEIIADALRLRSEKRYKECIAGLKRAASVYDRIAPAVLEYCNDVVAEYERSAAPDPGDEMKKLAAAVKNNIRAYIAAGNNAAARKTIEEYKQLMPADEEIKELETLIG